MTKGDIRKARKLARANGDPLDRELELPNQPACELSESVAGDRGRERWARYYDSLNGAPEGDWDR